MSKSWSVDGVTSAGYEDMHGMSFCLVGTENTPGLCMRIGHLGLARLDPVGVYCWPALGSDLGSSTCVGPACWALKYTTKNGPWA